MKSKTLINRLLWPGTLITNGQLSYNTLTTTAATTTTTVLLSSSSKAQNDHLNLTGHNRSRLSSEKLVIRRNFENIFCFGSNRNRTSRRRPNLSKVWLILSAFLFFFLFQSSSVVVSAFVIPSSNLDQNQNQDHEQNHDQHRLPVDSSDDQVTFSQSTLRPAKF